MKNIVITGSTRGIGFGLAQAFLDLGCRVALSGRSQAGVDRAVESLAVNHPAGRVIGIPCDVTEFEQIQALWEQAIARMGSVDIWINNAGLSQPIKNFWEHTPAEIRTVMDTNLTGAMLGSLVAMRGMLAQGYGAIYNLEGYGSSGSRMVKGLGLYGTTKAGLRFFDDSLMEDAASTPVIVGAIRPGMVITEMITDQYKGRPEEWQKASRIFNIIADRVETVAPWIAKKVLENRQNGVRIAWVSSAKITWRFLTAPFIKRKVID
jgi:NAD(P)-dependent dehydrogenase (short-subunit alcohol dehydrogenase family)